MSDVRQKTIIARLARVLSDPAKLREAIMGRIRRLPFRLGFWRVWPGAALAYIPDRYSENLAEYRRIGGFYTEKLLSDFFVGNRSNNCGDIVRFHFLTLLAEQLLAEGISGDTAELGVYKGNTAALVASLARRLGGTAYLFDTFAGFAADDLVEIDSGEQLEFQDTSLEAVQALVGRDNTRYIQGYFPQSLTQLADDPRFCLVHIDCDLYAPSKAALDYFYPRLVRGGFLVMHDYSSLRWKGLQKAVDEFFADKPEFVIPIPDKSGSAVLRKI